MAEPVSPASETTVESTLQTALSLARRVVREFALTDLEPLLHAAETQAEKMELNLAVLGRFKAGKSSFLNHLLRRSVLPVGVVPVTSVVTQICAGDEESACVRKMALAQVESIPIGDIGAYISEVENPGNEKKVSLVQLQLPEMQRYRGLQFVDTPGLESLFPHSTETTTAWSPNVDLALVAVCVDPPLTRQDAGLIEQLLRFTPNVSVLLTKVDQLDESGREEVFHHVGSEVRKRFGSGVRVFPYSIREGFEFLRDSLEKEYLFPELAARDQNRLAIMKRKLEELLRSSEAYLALALRAAEKTEAEQRALRSEFQALVDSMADRKLQIRLAAQHGIGHCRNWIEEHLMARASQEIQERLSESFEDEFHGWNGSFANVLGRFESWLGNNLEQELAKLSRDKHTPFVVPLQTVRRQIHQQLQNVRTEFSETLCHLTGVALPTAETEGDIAAPASPDISVGKIFDRNWELISPVIPMSLVRGALHRRFTEKIVGETHKNLSRLTSQWQEALAKAMTTARTEAEQRLDDYVATIGRMLGVRNDNPSEIMAGSLRMLEIARAKLVAFEVAENKTSLSSQPDFAE